MDKDFIRNIALALLVFALVLTISQRFMPPPAAPPAGGGSTPVTTTDGSSPAPPVASAPTMPAGEVAPASGAYTVAEAAEATALVIGATFDGTQEGVKPSSDPYRMRLTLSNIGASIESAEMTDHKATLSRPERYRLLAPVGAADGPQFRSLEVEKINIGVLGGSSGVPVERSDVVLRDRKWRMGERKTTEAGEEVSFSIEILRAEVPVLRLVRTYILPRQAEDEQRHDLRADITVENLSAEPLDVILTYFGGVGIRQEDNRADDRVVDYGLLAGGQIRGSRQTAHAVAEAGLTGKPLFKESTAGPGEKLSWAATANKYFACILAPLSEARDSASGDLAGIDAVSLVASTPEACGVTVRFVTRPLTLAAGGSRVLPIDVYLGEKDGGAFKSIADYAARNYYFQVGASVGWCTFAPLVDLMVALLNGVHSIVPNYGVAIMVLVFIVRFLLHPITKKGQVNMVRMQKRMGDFSPKMEEVKRKFGNDKTRMQQEMMRVYREEGVNPAGQLLTCLPMMLQMPIWVALFISLSNNIAMRHQPFAFWIQDLTAPDALIKFATPYHIPLMGAIASFNLLPFLVSMAMFVQQKTMPKPKPNPAMSDEQRQQQEMMQKMMPIMSVMMLFIFYSMPSGLTLYIMSSTVLGTLEQWRIRVHIRKEEEAGRLHKPKIKGPGDGGKRSGFMGHLFARLEAAADDAKKSQQGGKVRR